jgi:hypothetical protein
MDLVYAFRSVQAAECLILCAYGRYDLRRIAPATGIRERREGQGDQSV